MFLENQALEKQWLPSVSLNGVAWIGHHERCRGLSEGASRRSCTAFLLARMPRGVLLFIDEADVLLASRDKAEGMSEEMRNALTAPVPYG